MSTNVKEEKVKEKKAGRHAEPKECSFELCDVEFESLDNAFRVHVKEKQEKVSIWVEDQRSKTQWTTLFDSITSCGPSGIPKDFILENLLAALTAKPDSSNAPVANAQILNDAFTLTLRIVFSPTWNANFTFDLKEVALERCDVLEAKLRDALDDIEELKSQLATPVVMSIGSHHYDSSSASIVMWGGARQILPYEHFRMSADGTSVTVLTAGLYQIDVRMTGGIDYDTFFALLVNDVEVAHMYYQTNCKTIIITVSMTEIMEIKEGEVVTISISSNNYSTVGGEMANRLSMVKL